MFVIWYDILAPAGTPEPVLARPRREVADPKDPKVAIRLDQLSYQVSYLAGHPFRYSAFQDLGVDSD